MGDMLFDQTAIDKYKKLKESIMCITGIRLLMALH
jgi:hypothetical protein